VSLHYGTELSITGHAFLSCIMNSNGCNSSSSIASLQSLCFCMQAPYPTIQRVMKALYELPEVKASLPANQPDAPKS